MNQAPRLRLLRREDLAFADSLRALAGWNQTNADWERFLEFEPEGCFLAEWEGAPAGVVTTMRYGAALAWIGMALVHPDFRRRGIGRALLEQSVACLRDQGVRCVKLDATPEGKGLYQKLGFQEEWNFTRWAGEPRNIEPRVARVWRETDLDLIEPLDTGAFGVSRKKLIESLARQSCRTVVHKTDGKVEGYGMLRPGSRAFYLGPVIASAPAVLEALLPEKGEVFWDIPDRNATARQFAEAHKFKPQRILKECTSAKTTRPEPRNRFSPSLDRSSGKGLHRLRACISLRGSRARCGNALCPRDSSSGAFYFCTASSFSIIFRNLLSAMFWICRTRSRVTPNF